MTQELFQSGAVNDEQTERARRAVKAFRAMQPGLSGYARAITGRRSVSVELSDGIPRTDGTKIYFKPPIALGDLTPHSRSECERRDSESGQQLCPACRVREEVLITIYHEIAHIVFGTFQEVTEEAKIEALERAIEEVGGKYEARIRAAWGTLPYYKKNDYLNLSSLVSPFLPTLVNVLEDARVDEGMFKARRGTRAMFDAYTQGIFRQGVEDDSGEFVRWSDKPLNSQIVIGVFVLACGYDYAGWFAPEVEDALSDKDLRMLVGRVETLRSAEGSYNLAFPILARLRELGFCRLPDDINTPEEEENNDEAQAESDEAQDETGDSEDRPDEDPSSDSQDAGSGADGEDGDEAEGADGDSQSDGDGDSGDDSSSDADAESDAGSDDQSRADGSSSGEGESESESDGVGDAPAEGEDSSGSGGGSDESGDDRPHQSGDEVSHPEAGGPSDEFGSRAEGGVEDDDSDDEADGGPDREDREGDGDSHVADSSDADGEADDEVIDSGADEGRGGKRTEADYGTPEQALRDVQVFSQHEAHHDEPSPADIADEEAVDRAIIQGLYFEKPSVNVCGVREHKYGVPVLDANGRDVSDAWTDKYGYADEYTKAQLHRLGVSTDLDIPESVLGPALIEMRRTFSDNARANMERHLRSGKINQRVLGKRAWAGDDRLFQKKRLPGRRSYAVLIGIDISGSTVGLNLALAKRAAMAQAELCQRAGLDFAVYAHTANPSGGWGTSALWLDVYEIKSFDAPWDTKAKDAFEAISSDAENLDGHTIEFYRKMIERHPATDKVILYYSDGKMPAANHDEELEILQREIAYCKAKNITLLGVGIRTDSPRRHGLDTIQVDDDSDISSVVRHLEKSILRSNR